METVDIINIIGAGLAGCEAAYQAAKRGCKVRLYDIKPHQFTVGHSSAHLAELVCSNSLKSNELTNACGLLKQEMRELDSLIINIADETKVPAGGALAVDREQFAKKITEQVLGNKNIEFISGEVTKLPEGICIIATGPLTTEAFQQELQKLTGNTNLYFFDAAAPIIDASTIDYQFAYFLDRYESDGDYLNCPLNKEQYTYFINELLNAKKVPLKSFENMKVFEGCMPVEVMAARGIDTLRFGPLKPVGLNNPVTGERYYAVIQLRKENVEGSYYNMVGFQTNLTFSEQKRVFSLIPALKNAEFIKYGVMHRNTFINSPKLLDKHYCLKNSDKTVFFAGQICGVEGYVESAASGLMCGINAANLLKNKPLLSLNNQTMIGALPAYISAENKNFQPMNANFAIIKPLDVQIRDKKAKYSAYAQRSLNVLKDTISKGY